MASAQGVFNLKVTRNFVVLGTTKKLIFLPCYFMVLMLAET